MQVGLLGSINSMLTTSSNQSKPTTGFAGILESLTLQEGSQNESFGEEQQNQLLSKTEIAELIDFLSQTSEPEPLLPETRMNGLNVEESVVEDSSEMIRLTTELLQITDEELKAAIETFLTKYTKDSSDVSDEQGHSELVTFMKELPEIEAVEALHNYIALLPFIDVEQTQLSVEKDQLPLLKILKMVELLSSNLTEGSRLQVQDILQKAKKKLEVLLNHKVSSRREMLNKTFLPLVKELNEQQATNNKSDLVMNNRSVVFENIKVDHVNLSNSQGKQQLNEVDVKNFNQNQRFEFINGNAMPVQQMTRPEQLTPMLNSSGKMVSVEEFIQQFQSILSKSQLSVSGGAQKLFIKLNPESLGALRIEIIHKDGTLIAKIQTTTSLAKDVLESQLQSLRNAFNSQNIVVDKIEISQQINQQERFFNRDQQEQHEQNNQRQQQEQNQQNDQPQETFQEALLNVEV